VGAGFLGVGHGSESGGAVCDLYVMV
jgi:hypothetical protein